MTRYQKIRAEHPGSDCWEGCDRGYLVSVIERLKDAAIGMRDYADPPMILPTNREKYDAEVDKLNEILKELEGKSGT